MLSMTPEEEAMLLKEFIKNKPTCKECFCNDLCLFLLLRTGVATTCKDFQRRVKEVVDRELSRN